MKLGCDLIRTLIDDGIWKAYRDEERITSDELVVNPNSIDVTLGNIFLIPRIVGFALDPKDQNSVSYKKLEVDDGDSIKLEPGDCVLGCVRERFDVSNGFRKNEDSSIVAGVDQVFARNVQIAPMYEGRSTIARMFIATHVTAGFGDVGFDGYFTLEIVNLNPKIAVRLFPGMRIGQIHFDCVLGSNSKYSGAYKDQHKVEPRAPVLGVDRF